VFYYLLMSGSVERQSDAWSFVTNAAPVYQELVKYLSKNVSRSGRKVAAERKFLPKIYRVVSGGDRNKILSKLS